RRTQGHAVARHLRMPGADHLSSRVGPHGLSGLGQGGGQPVAARDWLRAAVGCAGRDVGVTRVPVIRRSWAPWRKLLSALDPGEAQPMNLADVRARVDRLEKLSGGFAWERCLWEADQTAPILYLQRKQYLEGMYAAV